MDCSLPRSPSMRFPRQQYQSGLPSPSPGDLPDPGIAPRSLHCRQTLYPLSHQGRQGTPKALAAQRILSTLKVSERGGEMKIKGPPGCSETPSSTVFRWSQTRSHFLHGQWLSQGRLWGPDYLEQRLAHRTLPVTVQHH